MAADQHHNPATMTEEQAGRMLAGMNEVIRAGEEMRRLRAEMIKMFVGLGWTQDTIARLAEMSQPAVSKQVTKYQADDPLPAMDLALDQRDAPWLEGRLWALADEISENCDAARCTRYVAAIARGRKRFTPQNVDELRRLVEEDLRLHQGQLPNGYRAAYDQISRGLDLPSRTNPHPHANPRKNAKAKTAPKPDTPEPASVRRTLAHQIQRDWLRGNA